MANTFQDRIQDRKAYAEKVGNEFRGIFSVSLNRFFDLLWGFDVIGFDEWLGVPDGTSTADFITEKHGKRGVEIVRALL